MSKLIQLDWQGNTAILTICRAEVKNSVSRELMDQWLYALKDLEHESKLRCLILASQGNESFISGGDLKDLHNLTDKKEVIAMSEKMGEILQRMEDLPVPVIAAIEGYAFGGGWEISCACDLRIASDKSIIGFREIYWGLTPGWAGTTRLVREVGKSWATWLLMTNRTIDTHQAQQIGFVHRTVGEGKVLQTCLELAKKLEGFPQAALKSLKRSLFEACSIKPQEALQHERKRFAELWVDEEHTSRVEKFLKS